MKSLEDSLPETWPAMALVDYGLRFAVVTERDGRVLMRMFRNPQDAEGITIRLTPLEREHLAHALAAPGFHAIARDEGNAERRKR